MRLFSCLVLGMWSLSSVVALAQSPEPSCACGRPEPTRFTPPQFVAPAMLMPTPIRAETVVVRTARIESPAVAASPDRAPLQISVPERLLNQLMADERAEVGPVRDVIANADVIGQQSTATRVVVDVRPNQSFAELHLVLTGVVSSETVGITSQAAVNTLGRHDVLAIKPVMFDGYQITTRRPRVWVDIHSEHVGAQTAFDGTLFGGFARNVAIKTANRQRDQVDAETAEHLVAQLGPKFNREADQQLGRFNREWREGGKARFGNLWPQSLSASSTDSQLLISASWADAPAVALNDTPVVSGKALAAGHSVENVDPELTVASAKPLKKSAIALAPFDPDAVTIRVHESAINAWLRTLELGGKTLTETELREPFDALMTKLGGRVMRRENKLANQPLPGTAPLIRLGKNDPVRVSFADGELRLTIVASIEVAGQTVLAQDEITVPFSSNIERGEWRVKAGQLAFAKGGNGISLASMVETLVRNQLTTAFPDFVLPDSIPLPASASTLSMRLARAEASSGWLTLSLAFGGTSSRGPTPEPQPEEPRPFEIVPPRLIAPMRLESRDFLK